MNKHVAAILKAWTERVDTSAYHPVYDKHYLVSLPCEMEGAIDTLDDLIEFYNEVYGTDIDSEDVAHLAILL